MRIIESLNVGLFDVVGFACTPLHASPAVVIPVMPPLPVKACVCANMCVNVCACAYVHVRVRVLQGRPVLATVLFAAVLCLKHTFLVVAPVFAVFLLRSASPTRIVLATAAAIGGTTPCVHAAPRVCTRHPLCACGTP